jgi:hypothetical protein
MFGVRRDAVPRRSTLALDAPMRQHLAYVSQPLISGVAGYLVVVPWVISWTALNSQFVAPIIQRGVQCCSSLPSDPLGGALHIYAVLDSTLAGIFAVTASFALGSFLTRVRWLFLWFTFCALAYLSIRGVLHSKIGISALLIFINPTVYVFPVMSLLGFWCGAKYQGRRARLTLVRADAP